MSRTRSTAVAKRGERAIAAQAGLFLCSRKSDCDSIGPDRSMSVLPYEPPEPPEPPESKNSARHPPGIPVIAYKIVGVILVALLIYWLWRTYTRFPPAQPIHYPADYLPTRSESALGLTLATRLLSFSGS